MGLAAHVDQEAGDRYETPIMNEWQLKYPNSSDRTFQHIDGTW
jgi:hypothetical protein